MRTPKKLKRLDFDSIAIEMTVVEEDLLRGIVGGYSNDCFWRCIAYLDSRGCNYSEADAERYANEYFGPEAGLYYYGAGVSDGDMESFLSSNCLTIGSFKIVKFDPNLVKDKKGDGYHAAVVLAEFDNYYRVFDPQEGGAYFVPKNAVDRVFGVNENCGSDSGSDTGSGSGSGAGSDFGSDRG